MPVHIILATTPQQYDEAFKLRHRVFVEEEQLFDACSDERIMDRFDAFSTTQNLLVYVGGRAVGSVRITLDSDVGMPADAYYDFHVHVPTDARIVHVGMLCIEKQYRSARLIMDLMQMIHYVSVSEGATHMAAPVNPSISRLLKRAGLHPVDEPFAEPGFKTLVMPLMLTLADVKDIFMAFLLSNQRQGFSGHYERSFYEKGEYVVRAGEWGKHAYVIMAGSATVTLPGSEEAIGTLGEGELFGELALITEETRSLNVIAASNLVLMRLSSEAFRRYFYHQPEKAETVLKLLGRRTRGLIGQLQAAPI